MLRMVAAGVAMLVLLAVAGVAALVAFSTGAVDDLDTAEVESAIDDLDLPTRDDVEGFFDRLPTLTTTTTTTLFPPTTEADQSTTTATSTTTSTTTLPRSTSRSGEVGDTLTLDDRNDNPISVAVVGLQDPGAPAVGDAARTVGVFVTYAFHGTDPASADPQSNAVPAGFVLHDQLGTRHGPAAPTGSCDGSLPSEITPNVPVSTCVPFVVPGSLEVFAIEWFLGGVDRAPDPGDLSWINR